MNKLATRIAIAVVMAVSWAALGQTLAAGQQSQKPTQGQQGQGAPQGQQGQAAPQGQQGQQSQPAAPAGQAAPQPTKQEVDDWNALRQEASTGLDFDRVIQLADDFEKKYPNSQMLTYVDMFAASAYQQKSDIDKSILYGEKSLKLKPDNLMTLIILADLLPTPQATKGNPADKDKKLSEAETYANRALQLITQMPKQPNETDDQLKKRKDALSADLHSALGMVHLQRSAEGLTGTDKDELAKAEQEYKLATATDKPSAQDFYRLGEVYESDGKIDEAIDAFGKASQAGQGGPIQPYADKKIQDLKKQKPQPAPPAKP